MKNLIFTTVFCLMTILLITDSYSQGTYEDINPDKAYFSNKFDFNKDGIVDIRTYIVDLGAYDYQFLIESKHADVYLFATPDNLAVDTLSFGAEIGDELYWANGSYIIIQNFAIFPFDGAVNKFIGFRIYNEGSYNYGWIRFSSPYMLDYSFCINSTEPIIAGKDVLHLGTNLDPKDIGDNMNASDLEANFTGAIDESLIIEYRAIVVKTENADEFNAELASNLPNDRYLPILPNNNEIYNMSFNADIRDSDGDTIRNLISYNLFVLSKIENLGTDSSLLSNPSHPIILTATTPSPTSVIGNDIADYGDGRDLEVSFAKAEDESKISFYGIFVVGFIEADTFNLDNALQVPEEFITFVEPTGEDVSIVLAESSKTIDGKLIYTGGYRVFIMSIANGITADQNSLSDGSNFISISNPDENILLAGMAPDYVIHVSLDSPLVIAPNFGFDSLFLDLNLDENPDIRFSALYTPMGFGEPLMRHSRVLPLGSNTVCVLPLEYQTPLTQILPYMEASGFGITLAFSYTSAGGPWYNIYEPKYMAVKIVEEADSSLAWIKAEIGTNYVKIFEYACWEYTSGITEFKYNIEVYPNPVTDYLYFKSVLSNEIKSYSIYNLKGQMAIETKLTFNVDRIDVSHLSTGIYLLQVNYRNGEVSHTKIVKR